MFAPLSSDKTIQFTGDRVIVSDIVMSLTSHGAWNKVELKNQFYTIYEVSGEWPQTCLHVGLAF